MPLLSLSVPVTLPESWGGLATSTGILRLDRDALVLEFETKDGVLEVLRSDVRRLELPLAELEACTWRPGWFSARIEIAVHHLEALRQAPGAEAGKLVLHVARADRSRASALVTQVSLALAQQIVTAVEVADERAGGRPGGGAP
jgi:hypothetical protein